MGQCFPGTPRPRNDSSWVGSYPLTWYPTNAHFQPRVRTSSRRCLPLIDPPRAVVPCRVSVRCRCGKDLRALQRPIECYGIRENKSLLERARGRSCGLSGFRRNGRRSFGNLRRRGGSKAPLVPYHWKPGQACSPICSWRTATKAPCPKPRSPSDCVSPFVPPRSPATTRYSGPLRR
jgi:hypothetical protein